ncbi:MAG: aminotransferase class V-fold PLP-dependent enzyme [Candidatus Latescibacteria bacterium]|nr:aminotransferase class V-fold PLP-dependent enzyme [Candidatus Latescibacterota bacterium]
MTTNSFYARLGVRTFINARGTITTMGGSIMPPQVVQAMAEASRHFVALEDLAEKAGARIAQLTGAPAAHICSGAAGGMMLAAAACLTGADEHAIQRLPRVDGRPDEFVISLVDSHYYVHQGFELCGGRLVKVGTPEAVRVADYAAALGPRTAAVVFFLGTQPLEQLKELIPVAKAHRVPIIVDAAAQLPPRSYLRDLPAMGVDLAVFSGGKGLFGPQSTGLVLGRPDLVHACALNGSPHSAIGRGMKVGKEEIAGLLTAVELFMAQDEDAVIRDWEARCRTIGQVADQVPGLRAEYTAPFANKFPPASPLVFLHFTPAARLKGSQVLTVLAEGTPSIEASGSDQGISFGPQTLQEGEAEIIADRLRELLGG